MARRFLPGCLPVSFIEARSVQWAERAGQTSPSIHSRDQRKEKRASKVVEFQKPLAKVVGVPRINPTA
jgi:hypothetical protein